MNDPKGSGGTEGGMLLFWIGMGLIFMEILSGLRFTFSMKVSSMIVMMLIFAAGAGLVLRSYWPIETKEDAKE